MNEFPTESEIESLLTVDNLKAWMEGKEGGYVGQVRRAGSCPIACFVADNTGNSYRVYVSTAKVQIANRDEESKFYNLPEWASRVVVEVDKLPVFTCMRSDLLYILQVMEAEDAKK